MKEIRTRAGEMMPFGMHFNDISRIMMGDLPPISYEQFTSYAVDTTLEVLAKIDKQDPVYIKTRELIDIVYDKLSALPARTYQEEPKHLESVRQARHRAVVAQESNAARDMESVLAVQALQSAIHDEGGLLITFYEDNPYEYTGESIKIGSRYEIGTFEFIYLTCLYVKGGQMGWSEDFGVPISAAEASKRLKLAVD